MALQIKESTVIEMVAHVGGTDSGTIKPTSTLDDDLGFDSLDRQELALLVEENFAVQLADDQPEKWKTVADVCADVQKLVTVIQ